MAAIMATKIRRNRYLFFEPKNILENPATNAYTIWDTDFKNGVIRAKTIIIAYIIKEYSGRKIK
jgi:hypothetical protein